MKKIVFIFCSMFFPFFVLAQDAGATASKSFMDDPFNHPLMPMYVVSFLIFIVILLTLVVSLLMLRVLNIFVENAAKEKAQKLGIAYVAPQSWWSKFWEDANAMVPIEQEKNIELDHDYDGIKELDNHLPPWWKGLFYGSMVFAVVYMIAYHFSDSLPLSGKEYENELAYAAEQARLFNASQPVAVVDENTLTYTNDSEIISRGKAVFVGNNCGSCHGNAGGGNAIGPNLTDAYWIHGGEIKNIFTTIKNGVVEKAMPAWGKVMNQKDVRDVAFYVMSLQGTNPPNAKAPQGELFAPKQEPVKSDSIKVQAMN